MYLLMWLKAGLYVYHSENSGSILTYYYFLKNLGQVTKNSILLAFKSFWVNAVVDRWNKYPRLILWFLAVFFVFDLSCYWWHLLDPSSKAVLFLFAYARRWFDKLTPLWKVALQWTHTFLLNSPFSVKR